MDQKIDIYKQGENFYIMTDILVPDAIYTPGNFYMDNTLCESTAHAYSFSYNDKLQGDFISLHSNIRYRFINGYLTQTKEYIDIDKQYFAKTFFDYSGMVYFAKRKMYYFKDNFTFHNELGPALMEYDRNDEVLRGKYYLNGRTLSKQEWEDQVKTKLYW